MVPQDVSLDGLVKPVYSRPYKEKVDRHLPGLVFLFFTWNIGKDSNIYIIMYAERGGEKCSWYAIFSKRLLLRRLLRGECDFATSDLRVRLKFKFRC